LYFLILICNNPQVVAVLIATGHIAANNFGHARYTLYVTMGWEMPPKLPLSLGDPGPCLLHGS